MQATCRKATLAKPVAHSYSQWHTGQTIHDGYYAVPYFEESEQGTLFQVITYRRADNQMNPDLLHLEFAWDELR